MRLYSVCTSVSYPVENYILNETTRVCHHNHVLFLWVFRASQFKHSIHRSNVVLIISATLLRRLKCLKIEAPHYLKLSVSYIDDVSFSCWQTLTVFVAVYILQYFAAVITGLWSLGRSLPTACVILTVIFTNLGGVFNFVAYTLLRHQSISVHPQPGAAVGWMNILWYCTFRGGSYVYR